MPPLQVANAALVTLAGWLGTRSYVNVLGANVLPTTTINQALADTLDAAIKAAFTANMQIHVSPSGGLAYIGLRDIRSANLPEFKGSGGPVPGTATGDPLPPSVSAVVSLRTARAGQSFRGRIYLGGFTEAANDTTGGILAAVNSAAVAYITAISTALSSNGLQLAVVSRPAERKTVATTVFHGDGTTSTDTQTSDARSGQVTQVTSITARNAIWDNQRRRAAAGSGSSLLREIETVHLGGSQ